LSYAAPQALAQSTDPLLLVSGAITLTTGEVTLLPWYQMDPGPYVSPTPGPYKLVFLDTADQEIVGYTQAFTVGTRLQYAGPVAQDTGGLAFFAFAAPYTATMAKVQIRQTGDGGDTVLQEIVPGVNAPSVNIDPPSSTTWSGPQPITWQSDVGTRYFAVDISTDNGASWEALAVNLTEQTYTLETVSLPDTAQALVRVAATDGLRTTTDTAGPFTIDNPPMVAYVSPPPGATGVSVWEPIIVGFRDAMHTASIDEGTLSLTGGPFGGVVGTITYDAATREATFTPKVPLAYNTTYTAQASTGIRDSNGQPLPVAKTWTFTTEVDIFPPRPVAFSPKEGALDVPLNTQLVVVWDQALAGSTVNSNTFKLATATGSPVNGTVVHDATTHTTIFAPASDLVTGTIYIATLKAGIQDTDGNPTEGDFNWAFATGSDTESGLAFTGAYVDSGEDTNGDWLFEQLVIKVGVQVTTTGSYGLRGTLVDADGAQITWAHTDASLDPGVHFLDLFFDGTSIGGHGVDGPYTLTDLTLVRTDGTSGTAAANLLAVVSEQDAYRTTAYAAERFPAPLSFSGLPDLVLIPGTTFLDAFNVQDYASHILLPSDQLSYTLMLNTDLKAGVQLSPTGDVHVRPEPYWLGSTKVTVRADDGTYAAQDSFNVLVGWPLSLYLPLVLRNSSGVIAPATRNAWITVINDDFESESFSWRRTSWYDWLQLGEGHQWFWDRRDCAAYSGQNSAWPYGGGDDGETTSCGAEYPNTLGSKMCLQTPVNLEYVAKAEYRMKVWTDLAPGDEICLLVTNQGASEDCRGAQYYGICRSGRTNGWEDMALDLANVPTLGNLLGQEQVWVAVQFEADGSGSRPAGVYVDDVMLRICPEGLTDYCEP
jgi:hypothetical protein